jgi:hypothetical protein
MSVASNHHLEIVPSNITSDGKLSYKNGQPTIQLLIGAQERYIVPGSIRLCGNFTIMKDSADIPADGDGIRMNERLGIYSVIDTLSIFSQNSGQTIESINHHNRMMSSYLSVTQSQGDFACHAYETSLRFPNYKAQQVAVVENTQGGSGGDSPNSFCIPLVSGLFMGLDPIPLSNQWGVGGIQIEIQLAPDQQVLFSDDNTDTNLLNAYYELSNVRLICEVQSPSMDQMKQIQSQTANTFTYNSISSYYNTINSANAILNFNLGLKSVLGAFMNVVPSGHINSFTRDGLATLPFTNSNGSVANVEQAVFTRAGERFPLEYNIDTLQKTTAGNTTGDPQLIRNYMDAVMGFSKIARSSVDTSVWRNFDCGTNYLACKQIIKGGSAWGLGISYDQISNSGIDFSMVPFGCQLQLGLTSDHPNAIFLFVHSRQTIVSSQGSIQVMK